MADRNPNKTITIENNWHGELKLRIKQLDKAMRTIPINTLSLNVTVEQQAQITNFMQKMTEYATGIMLSDNWQNKYQTQAYERGIERADREIKAALTPSEAALAGTLDIEPATLIHSFEHQNELDFLHDRANEKLKGWIDKLLVDTRSILHEQAGIVSVEDIHASISERIQVTQSRATTIEVSEIGQAAQKSVLIEVEQLNANPNLDVTAKILWVSVGDDRVRSLHARFNGQIMSNEQAARNITISPWNCRCGFKVVIDGRVSDRVVGRVRDVNRYQPPIDSELNINAIY